MNLENSLVNRPEGDNFSNLSFNFDRGIAYKKLADFEIDVVNKMFIVDDISISVAGSYKSNPSKVRMTSDIDVIIFSETLRDPDTYVQFLREFNRHAIQYKEDHQKQPVFFTHASNEASVIYLSKITNSIKDVDILPCHFLYYHNIENFYHREPKKLADRLLETAGVDTEGLVMGTRSVQDSLLWDLERSVAQFVLNDKLLPKDYRKIQLVDSVITAFRVFADETMQLNDASVDVIIAELGMKPEFDKLVNIRKNGVDSSTYSTEELLQSVCNLIHKFK